MKRALALVALLFSLHANASPQLESLLAPIALQPDPVLWDVLEASKTPQEVIDAAAGRGSHSPAVQSLLAYPELLARMAESPQWLMDLGSAYMSDPHGVLQAVHALRQRAHANGYAPAPDQVAHYYPSVVYGPAWRPAYPVYPVYFWRPWAPRPVYVVHRQVIVHRPVVVHRPAPTVHVHAQPRNGLVSPAVRLQQEQAVKYQQHHRVPESKRQPIVHAHDGHRAAHAERAGRHEHRQERHEHRQERHGHREHRRR